ncbi:MAG: histidinol-phosphatase HisJ family protein, partial [Candidatus Peregrinibacteria bacterium]
MLLIDYHVHNHFSPDSDTDTAEILKKLEHLGVTEMCFANHAEWFDESSPSGVHTFDLYEALRRFESIKWEVERLKPQFPKLKIRIGAELTYDPSYLKTIEQFQKEAGLDFVIGSVHEIDGFVISSSKHCQGYFEGKTEAEAYEPYFAQLQELVAWGQFSVVGHLDVIKKYGCEYFGAFQPEKYKTPIVKALKVMAQKGLGLELNTGSLRKRCRELFPHPLILQWAVEAGVEHFTLGSD